MTELLEHESKTYAQKEKFKVPMINFVIESFRWIVFIPGIAELVYFTLLMSLVNNILELRTQEPNFVH